MDYAGNLLDECSIYSYDLSLHFVNRLQLNKTSRSGLAGILTQDNLVASNSERADYMIQSLEQDFTFQRSLSTIGAEYRMSIFEPNGTSLLPRILEISERQDKIVSGIPGHAPWERSNVSSHMAGAYVITVRFRGRDRENRPMRDLPVFHYPCATYTGGISFEVTSAGTQYELALINTSQEEFNYLAGSSQSEFTVLAADVGEFIEEFNKAARANMENTWALDEGSIYMDEMKIALDPGSGTDQWATWKFPQKEADGEDPDAPRYDTVTGKTQFRYVIGSSLRNLIDTVLRTTKEYKRIPTLGKEFVLGDDSEDPGGGTGMSDVPCLFRLVAEVEYGEFDPLRVRNRRSAVYRIMKFAEPAIIPSVSEYNRCMDTTTGVQEARIRKLREGGFLRKKYDFMFGETANTDVTSLQFVFDNAYFNVSPIGKGKLGDHDYAVTLPGDSSVRDSIEELRKIKKEAIIRAHDRTTSDGLVRARRSLTAPIDPRILAEEIKKVGELAGEVRNSMSQWKNPWPRRTLPDTVGNQYVGGPEDDRSGNRLRFGGIMENLEDKADMVEMEVGIRGDPYWLGNPSPFGAAGDPTTEKDDRLADYMKGAPMFRLLAHFPHPAEDAHGRRRPRADYSLAGVYFVNRMTSRFEGGLFEQTLMAQRDSSIVPDPKIDRALDTGYGDAFADRTRSSAAEWGRERSAAAKLEEGRLTGGDAFADRTSTGLEFLTSGIFGKRSEAGIRRRVEEIMKQDDGTGGNTVPPSQRSGGIAG